jgi:predicted RNA-binding protein Jag
MHTDEIKKIIEEFIGMLPVQVESITIEAADGRAPVFTIKTPDSGALIGSQGATFQALSLLIKKVVAARAKSKNLDEPRFFVDINDYRAGIASDITAKASILAERARSLRTDVEMEPMNPYERLIVHEFLATAPNIKTESVGDGKTRRVVIRFKEDELDLSGI